MCLRSAGAALLLAALLTSCSTASPPPSGSRAPSDPSAATPSPAAPAGALPPATLTPGRCGGLPHDLDGDGSGDLAVGAPAGGEGHGQGAVTVVHGDGRVPDPVGKGSVLPARLFTQAEPVGEDWDSESAQGFGSGVAVGDFDRDGCADLAVEQTELGPEISVLSGSPRGVRNRHRRELTTPDTSAAYGPTMVTGDFDGDRFTDLAVVFDPGYTTGNRYDTGVQVWYGSRHGLARSRPGRRIHRSQLGITVNTDAADLDATEFAGALAAGDLTGDGVDDLVVGVPGLSGERGAVVLVRGRRGSGLSPVGSRRITQETPGVPGGSQAHDRFGASVAVGDLTGDGHPELAIGAPGEDTFGAVTVLLGGRRGLRDRGATRWDQESAGVPGDAQPDDGFGAVLLVAPLDGDDRADLAVGATDDRLVDGGPSVGSVTVLHGAPGGVTGAAGVLLTEELLGGSEPEGGGFGATLTASPVHGASAPWTLVVGAPYSSDDEEQSGAVWVVGASAGGPTTTGSARLVPGGPGIDDRPGYDGYFGIALG